MNSNRSVESSGAEIVPPPPRLTARWAASLVRAYQLCLSGLKPPCCRFQPSCSEYARQAILKFGLARGSLLACGRLLRCQPFYHGPVYDPVPAGPPRAPRPPRTPCSHEIR